MTAARARVRERRRQTREMPAPLAPRRRFGSCDAGAAGTSRVTGSC
ncbi:hypothetical protein GSH05_15615 [Burkholderia pseudomallei]|uniref:Uncharacterized protein n=5 Tax=pseudomallei group TaxID=111527 RepID=A0AAX1XC22_BURML|nr:hypothetical protein BMAA1234 [Burkholderia mallei ATCC 23344]ABM49484.1 hypothetical protein BMASAVP1_0202 [Burkholderia mallei SAVP1]ABN88032.1 conserved hypothetical protein [Burkholderia pseudomallei 668]ABN95533.1 conserved hypothetical protein [Burkholderia pseudomallei 1106a]ABO03894.1 hypothetical protein BMA10247_A1097 [Burkholderia mallei NCTC 10247]AFR19301.1 hypothetical protein BPC006_II1373 [Burkholderia pseudomallei BPC006]AUG24151.1 hypothetical protein CXQ84_27280 [Burkhol